MRSKRVHVRLSPRLLEKIDEAARANINSRSGFIRESIVMRLNEAHLVPNPGIEDTLELLRQTGKRNT